MGRELSSRSVFFEADLYSQIGKDGHSRGSWGIGLQVSSLDLVSPFIINLTLFVVLLQLFVFSMARAQEINPAITIDGTLGTHVQQNGNTYDITGGARPGMGGNIFHSFDQFSIPNGKTANFLNLSNLSTSNILSRVTGGQPSQILGRIQTSGFGEANLFFLNPAGVIFGPNASLDIGGSFHATTADFLQVGQTGKFYADVSENSVLTLSSPESFGFLSSAPRGISIEGGLLKVNSGKTLSLTSGDILIHGANEGDPSGLRAPGGQLSLVSVASSGMVEVNPDSSLNDLLSNSFEFLGEILLDKGTSLDVSGDPAGTVLIRGGRLTIEGGGGESGTTIRSLTQGQADHAGLAIDIVATNEVVLAATNAGGVAIQTESVDSGQGGDIHIESENGILLQGDVTNGFSASIESASQGMTENGGAGGSIEIHTGVLNLQDGAFISTETSGAGQGGNVSIHTDRLNIAGIQESAQISAKAFDLGTSGQLNIIAPQILLQGGGDTLAGLETQVGFLDQESPPDSGNISIAGDQIHIVDGAQIVTGVYGEGKGGDIDLNAKSLVLSGIDSEGSPAAISAVLPFPAGGQAGAINIKSETIDVTNGGEIGSFSGSFGDSGNIDLTTSNLRVTQAGLIVSSNIGIGVAGDIHIEADEVVLQGPGLLDARGTGIEARSSVQALGGGNIALDTQRLNILDGAKIQSSTLGMGAGGEIDILTNDLLIAGVDPGDNSFDGISAGIFSSTRQIMGFEDFSGGHGGDITIQVREARLQDRGTVSVVSTGPGRAGNIEISSGNLSLKDGARVSGESTFTGNAGNILLTAVDTILLDGGSISTESAQASGGNIKLDAGHLIQFTDSEVTSFVKEGANDAGRINIDPEFIVVQNSLIDTSADVGDGGDVTIVADSAILIDSFSTIDTSSRFGGSGIVDIQAPIQNLSGTIAPLPEETTPVTALYGARCAAGQGGNFSTFVDSKVDSLSPKPSRFLASPLLNYSADEANPVKTSAGSHSQEMLTASITPLVFGHTGQPTTVCP